MSETAQTLIKAALRVVGAYASGETPEASMTNDGFEALKLMLRNWSAKNIRLYYTKTDTSALSHVLAHITDLYEQAVYAGAQLLDSSKKAAESAETARLKQASSGSTLASIVRNVAKGVEDQLKMIAKWKGENPDEVEFLPITESPSLRTPALLKLSNNVSRLKAPFSQELTSDCCS